MDAGEPASRRVSEPASRRPQACIMPWRAARSCRLPQHALGLRRRAREPDTHGPAFPTRHPAHASHGLEPLVYGNIHNVTLRYLPRVRLILFVLACLGLLTTLSSAVSAEPARVAVSGEQSISADEFCGGATTTQVMCPKTGLPVCKCFMAGTHATELDLILVTPAAVTVKAKRPRSRVKMIHWPPVSVLTTLHNPAPPERPPRHPAA